MSRQPSQIRMTGCRQKCRWRSRRKAINVHRCSCPAEFERRTAPGAHPIGRPMRRPPTGASSCRRHVSERAFPPVAPTFGRRRAAARGHFRPRRRSRPVGTRKIR
jgi:hypothetical protein